MVHVGIAGVAVFPVELRGGFQPRALVAELRRLGGQVPRLVAGVQVAGTLPQMTVELAPVIVGGIRSFPLNPPHHPRLGEATQGPLDVLDVLLDHLGDDPVRRRRVLREMALGIELQQVSILLPPIATVEDHGVHLSTETWQRRANRQRPKTPPPHHGGIGGFGAGYRHRRR